MTGAGRLCDLSEQALGRSIGILVSKVFVDQWAAGSSVAIVPRRRNSLSSSGKLHCHL